MGGKISKKSRALLKALKYENNNTNLGRVDNNKGVFLDENNMNDTTLYRDLKTAQQTITAKDIIINSLKREIDGLKIRNTALDNEFKIYGSMSQARVVKIHELESEVNINNDIINKLRTKIKSFENIIDSMKIENNEDVRLVGNRIEGLENTIKHITIERDLLQEKLKKYTNNISKMLDDTIYNDSNNGDSDIFSGEEYNNFIKEYMINFFSGNESQLSKSIISEINHNKTDDSMDCISCDNEDEFYIRNGIVN